MDDNQCRLVNEKGSLATVPFVFKAPCCTAYR